MQSYSATTMLILGIITLGTAMFVKLIHELQFSKLRHIPGPKLAAFTRLYESYYDVILRGKYTWRIAEMHEKYGPIVRVAPNEVHLNNPDYLDTVYTLKGKWDKDPWFAEFFMVPKSSFGTVDHDIHKARRSLIAPFFTMPRVHKLETMIVGKLGKLTKRLTEAAAKRQPLRADVIFSALIVDIVTEYTSSRCYNYLDSEDFELPWAVTSKNLTECTMISRHMPLLFTILASLPKLLVRGIYPKLVSVMEFEAKSSKEISIMHHQTLREISENKNPIGETPLFQTILQVEKQDEAKERAMQEYMSIVIAGTDTTANTLTVIMFHVLNSPKVHKELRRELFESTKNSGLEWKNLEKLPYLTGVIHEGLRLSYGFSGRNQRICQDSPLKIGKYEIPPKTSIGMTSALIHHNESIFPDSHRFTPTRWTDPSERKRLTKYLLAFGKGSRQCIGMNLGYANLYLTIATLFLTFDMELYETTESDIRLEHDCILPRAKGDSKGVRVIFKPRY